MAAFDDGMVTARPAIALTGTMNPPATIGWHADSYDETLASVRYRLLLPLAALRDAGVAIERYDPARADDYRAVVFCKSHSPAAVAIARGLHARGAPVIYDLCDNLFAAARIGHASAARCERMRAVLGLASHVTFATDALRQQIAAEVPEIAAPMSVVPDAIEVDPPALPARLGPVDRMHIARLNRFLARHDGALHAIWFGKNLGRAAGYVHLAAAAEQLAQFGAPATLTIMSNDRLRAWAAARRWRVPVHYTPWRLATARALIARHRVALIPVERNDYTQGKTINRPATALLAGLGVVADPIPSYEELRPFIVLGDWPVGLARYAEWSDATQATLAAGRAHVAARYGPAAVAAQWRAVLARV